MNATSMAGGISWMFNRGAFKEDKQLCIVTELLVFTLTDLLRENSVSDKISLLFQLHRKCVT